MKRISQQGCAQALAFEFLINRQASHAHGGYCWVSRQLLSDIAGKVSQQDACRCQGVVARNTLLLGERHKTGGHSATNVLRDLLSEVLIQLPGPRAETGAIMLSPERRDAKRRATHSALTSLRRRANARFNAGAGRGGDNSACAKHA